MDESVRERAFEPYFSTKAPWESGGLGLSTVAGVVERSGGATSIYSEPGIGTTIKTYFPTTTKAPGPDIVPPPVSSEPGDGERVLVVEDNELMLKILTRMLESSNYVPVAARSGRDALQRLEEGEPFAVVLSDVVMPGMSGRDLLGHLRRSDFAGQFIFMSGYTSEILDRHGVLPNEVFYLQKPFTRAEVLAILARALGKRGRGGR
jgi:two-component system cell cycle sensor histidine kinase/response regulator CckA